MRIGKIVIILGKLVLLLAVLGVCFYGFLYLKYNEDLPTGLQGVEADALANKMLVALNYEAYKNTLSLEWTFRNKNRYNWNKKEGICEVFWKDYKVVLALNNPEESTAFVHNFEVHDQQASDLIQEAINNFNNDSFWLVAPYKVFDPGTERRLINFTNSEPGLLITYTSGGSTPGDSYLWKFDTSGKPISFKMWTSKISIKGLEASWDNWITTETGAMLPSHHKILFLTLNMGDVKTAL